VPPLGNIAIALVKNTALVGAALAATDLLKAGGIVESRTFNTAALFIVVLGYLLLTIPLAFVVNRLERRLAFAR
jgi:ABC-type amino acid transport system permease subunit